MTNKIGDMVKVKINSNPEIFRPFLITNITRQVQEGLTLLLFDGVLYYDGEKDKPYEFIRKTNLYFSSDKHSMLFRDLRYGDRVGDVLISSKPEDGDID